VKAQAVHASARASGETSGTLPFPEISESVASRWAEVDRERQLQVGVSASRTMQELETEKAALTGRLKAAKFGITVHLDRILQMKSKISAERRILPDLSKELSELASENSRLESMISDAQQDLCSIRDTLRGPCPGEDELLRLRLEVDESDASVKELQSKVQEIKLEGISCGHHAESSQQTQLHDKKLELLRRLRAVDAEQSMFRETLIEKLTFALDKEERVLGLMKLQREVTLLSEGAATPAASDLPPIPEHSPVLVALDYECNDIEAQQAGLARMHGDLKAATEVQQALRERLLRLERELNLG
jgi:hypothetical protein